MAIQWNKNQIFESLPLLQMQLESIQSALEDVGSQEEIDDLIYNFNEPLANYLALKDRVSATFNKLNNQIVGASEEDIEQILQNLTECTRIIDSINYKISWAQSLITKIPSRNQNNAQQALGNEERNLQGVQNENYEIGQFIDLFAQFSNNALEAAPHETFEKLINLYKELKEYSLKKTNYLNSENEDVIPRLLKQITQWMQTIISEQEKIEMEQIAELEKMEKEQNEKENCLPPLEKLQCALALQDSNQSKAVDESFKELESEDKEKLLGELNKILLENKTIRRELQSSILGQLFSTWPGNAAQKLAAIEKILPPAQENIPPSAQTKIQIQFLAEKMVKQMKEALESPTRNNNSNNRPVDNSNEIVPINNINPNFVSNFTISCQPPLSLGSTLFIRGIDGNWDNGIPLVETQPNLWKFNGKHLGNQECKFLINDDKNFWEKLNGNRKIVNGELIHTQGAEFEKIPESLEENLEGFIIFVNFGFDENKYKIAICGKNIEGKNDWDEKNPLFLANNEGCWSVQIHKKTITEPIYFKYVLVPKNNGEKLIWEKDLSNGSNRTIGDMTEPKF